MLFNESKVSYSSIGLDGSVVNLINNGNLLQPAHKRSVIGAEKRFVPVRAAAEMFDSEQNNEYEIVENFDNIRWFYRANRNVWDFLVTVNDAICYVSLGFSESCSIRRNARRYRAQWSRGRDALDNIDVSWNQVIRSLTTYTGTEFKWVVVGDCATDGNENGPGAPGLWGQGYNYINNVPVPGHTECIGGVLYQWQEVEYVMIIPTKNDALIGPEYAVWNPGEDPNDRLLNWLYDDIPADGGYNHFEIRRHKRAYTQPDVFQQGDPAPPMQEAAQWVEFEVFQ